MDPLNEARRTALEARRKMLDARPEDAMPPLPDSTAHDETDCVQYFKTAGDLYAQAAHAFSAGDVIGGHTLELWAFQYITIGQACEGQLPPRA